MRFREHWPVARSRLRRREFATVFSRVPPGALGDMLEVGSGDGFLASLLAPLGTSLTTTEYAPGAASHGCELPRLRCSVTELPFADTAFDFIFSSSVLEHVRDRDGAMAELRRCLRPRGVMIHLMPSPTWKLLQLALYYPHVALSGIEMIGADRQLPATTGEPSAATIAPAPEPAADRAPKPAPKPAPERSTDDAADPAPGAAVSTEQWRDGGVKPSWWQEFKRGVFPQVHGEFTGHVRELLGFRAKAWAAAFCRAGFEVRGCLRLPLCSGYGFGFERLRRAGERFGLGAHNAFVVTHPGAPLDCIAHWCPGQERAAA
jgi:SAM-dependent methyltransferase